MFFLIYLILGIYLVGGEEFVFQHKLPPFPISPLTWQEATQKATPLVNKMSLEEKVGIMTGNGDFIGPCIGNTGAVDNLFPSLCMQDGPIGVSVLHAALTYSNPAC
jgi:hypothetical protein